MQVLSVLEASCRDCHRCLRYCPVGAIGFGQDQAWIIEDKCIYCGRCVNVCPQGAKVPIDRTSQLKKYLDSGQIVVASVAPSFVAGLEMDDYRQFVGALKELGFSYVAETVHGAQFIAQEYHQLAKEWGKPLISACCPTIVNLVEKHYPEMIPNLAPVISPMMLHGQILKKTYGQDAKVVFFGPCIAKIDELNRPEAENGIDLVMTFRQLKRLLDEMEIDFSQVREAEFDQSQKDWPRNYPLCGGTISASALGKEYTEEQILVVSGIEECIQTIDDIRNGRIQPVFLEMLACSGGCINGPEVDLPLGVAARRQLVVKYNKTRLVAEQNQQKNLEHQKHENQQTQQEQQNREVLQEHQQSLQQHQSENQYCSTDDLCFNRTYTNRSANYMLPDEKEIREILQRIGKFSKDDETNCGGCGYKSCREKAIAVFQGVAEEKMCIPYMKGRIESLSHVIVETSHNAIIVVNREMIIQEFNPVANRIFNRRDESPIGQSLYRYIDPTLFKQVWEEKKHIVHQRVRYEQYQLVTDQTIFPIDEYGVIIGIFTDVTEQEEQKVKVKKMKKMAVEKAADVVHKQMKIVQEITGLLGETTVETKAALYELTELIEEGE